MIKNNQALTNSSDSKLIEETSLKNQPKDSKPLQEDSIIDQPKTPSKLDEPTSDKQDKIKVVVGSLNVHSGIGKDARVLFRLEEGSTASVLKDHNNWLHISTSDGREGYLMKEFTESVE